MRSRRTKLVPVETRRRVAYVIDPSAPVTWCNTVGGLSTGTFTRWGRYENGEVVVEGERVLREAGVRYVGDEETPCP